jgi:hypothetical protein
MRLWDAPKTDRELERSSESNSPDPVRSCDATAGRSQARVASSGPVRSVDDVRPTGAT